MLRAQIRKVKGFRFLALVVASVADQMRRNSPTSITSPYSDASALSYSDRTFFPLVCSLFDYRASPGTEARAYARNLLTFHAQASTYQEVVSETCDSLSHVASVCSNFFPCLSSQWVCSCLFAVPVRSRSSPFLPLPSPQPRPFLFYDVPLR